MDKYNQIVINMNINRDYAKMNRKDMLILSEEDKRETEK